MNENTEQPRPNPANQQEFLRVFLANEREILRYVVALVPNLGDAQEIVQQTAVLLWEKFDQYDAKRPFAPWACRFALNVTRQWIDRRKSWKALLEGGLAEELALRREQLRPEFDERLVHLDQCLQKLPEYQRSMLECYYFRQQDIDVVAGQVRRSVEATYKALQRIRKQLRDCIEVTLRKEAAQ